MLVLVLVLVLWRCFEEEGLWEFSVLLLGLFGRGVAQFGRFDGV